MLSSIKKITSIAVIILLVVLLLLGLGLIWDSVTIEVAKDVLTKIGYTLAAVYLFSLLVILIDSQTGKK